MTTTYKLVFKSASNKYQSVNFCLPEGTPEGEGVNFTEKNPR